MSLILKVHLEWNMPQDSTKAFKGIYKSHRFSHERRGSKYVAKNIFFNFLQPKKHLLNSTKCYKLKIEFNI